MVCRVLSGLVLLSHAHATIDISAAVVVGRLLVAAGLRLKCVMDVVMFEPVLVRSVYSCSGRARCKLLHIQWMYLLLLLLPFVVGCWRELLVVCLLELHRRRLCERLSRSCLSHGRLVVGERRRQIIKRR